MALEGRPSGQGRFCHHIGGLDGGSADPLLDDLRAGLGEVVAPEHGLKGCAPSPPCQPTWRRWRCR
jgi:hypothetical protein